MWRTVEAQHVLRSTLRRPSAIRPPRIAWKGHATPSNDETRPPGALRHRRSGPLRRRPESAPPDLPDLDPADAHRVRDARVADRSRSLCSRQEPVGLVLVRLLLLSLRVAPRAGG